MDGGLEATGTDADGVFALAPSFSAWASAASAISDLACAAGRRLAISKAACICGVAGSSK